MINLETVLSAFNKQGTLLKWLQKLENALKGDTLAGVTVSQPTPTQAVLTFNFSDGTNLSADPITLAAGPAGPKGDTGATGATGPQGPAGANGKDGLPGEVGAIGPQGLRGPEGPAGPIGPQGPRGIQGLQGVPGTDGRSFTIVGQVDSVNNLPLPAAPFLGQAYFVGISAPRDVYTCVDYNGNLQWENQGKLQGPEGATGPEGPIGPQGEPGATGPEGPAGANGSNGNGIVDIYTVGHTVSGNETITNVTVATDKENLSFEVHASNGTGLSTIHNIYLENEQADIYLDFDIINRISTPLNNLIKLRNAMGGGVFTATGSVRDDLGNCCIPIYITLSALSTSEIAVKALQIEGDTIGMIKDITVPLSAVVISDFIR